MANFKRVGRTVKPTKLAVSKLTDNKTILKKRSSFLGSGLIEWFPSS